MSRLSVGRTEERIARAAAMFRDEADPSEQPFRSLGSQRDSNGQRSIRTTARCRRSKLTGPSGCAHCGKSATGIDLHVDATDGSRNSLVLKAKLLTRFNRVGAQPFISGHADEADLRSLLAIKATRRWFDRAQSHEPSISPRGHIKYKPGS